MNQYITFTSTIREEYIKLVLWSVVVNDHLYRDEARELYYELKFLYFPIQIKEFGKWREKAADLNVRIISFLQQHYLNK